MRLFIVILCSINLLASAASGASITLNSSGASSYQLSGNGFSKVAALNVSVTYDPSALEAPRISQGPLANGTIFVANPNLPGEIKIAFIHQSGVSGTGGTLRVR